MARVNLNALTAGAPSKGKVSTGSLAGGGTASVVVTLSPAMPDLNYTVAASVEHDGADLRVLCVTARTATQVTVLVSNADTLNAATGTLHVLALKD